jgi:hypothetical protein
MSMRKFEKKLLRGDYDSGRKLPSEQVFHEDDQVRNCSELKKGMQLVYIDKELSARREIVFTGYRQGNLGTQALLYDMKAKKVFPHYLTELGLEPYAGGGWNNKQYLRIAPIGLPFIRLFD